MIEIEIWLLALAGVSLFILGQLSSLALIAWMVGFQDSAERGNRGDKGNFKPS